MKKPTYEQIEFGGLARQDGLNEIERIIDAAEQSELTVKIRAVIEQTNRDWQRIETPKQGGFFDFVATIFKC